MRVQDCKWLLVMLPWLCLSCGRQKEEDTKVYALPQLRITIPSPEVQKDVWTKDCGIEIVDIDGLARYMSFHAQVEGRGNSTFSKPKKPYNLKLEKADSLLGMPPHKRWVLLANFFDHSLMRNALAFEVARRTSLAATTPQGRFVELTVNGEKQGVYYLCERVRDKVPKGTLLVEFDVYAYEEDPLVFRTERRQLPVSVRSPQKMPVPLWQTTRDLVNRIERGDTSILDMASFADFWIVHELCQNAEPNGPRSCFVHSLPDGRFAAGPVWDFDLSFITKGLDKNHNLRPMRFFNVDTVASTLRRLDSEVLYNDSAFCFDVLLQQAPFRHCVKERWKKFRPEFGRMDHFMDSIDALIGVPAHEDQLEWNHQEPARFDTCSTYASSVRMLKATYLRRLEVLDSIIGTW